MGQKLKKELEQANNASVLIQTMARGAIQRKKFKKALHQAREEAKVENRLQALQLKFEEAEGKRLEAEKIEEERKIAQHKTAELMNHHSMIIGEKERLELEHK